MKKTHRKTLFFLLVLALLAVTSTVALAKELDSVVIRGPGIDGELTINDPDEMMGLMNTDFFFRPVNVKPPENLGEGYHIRAFMNFDGQIAAFVDMMYYPAEEGAPGYVHYTGQMGETIGELDATDDWSLLLAAADGAFRSLMTKHNIDLQPAFAASAPVAASAAETSSESGVEPVNEPAADPVIIPAPVENKAQAVSEPAAVPPAAVDAPVGSPDPVLALALAGVVLALLGGGLILLRRRSPAQQDA